MSHQQDRYYETKARLARHEHLAARKPTYRKILAWTCCGDKVEAFSNSTTHTCSVCGQRWDLSHNRIGNIDARRVR